MALSAAAAEEEEDEEARDSGVISFSLLLEACGLRDGGGGRGGGCEERKSCRGKRRALAAGEDKARASNAGWQWTSSRKKAHLLCSLSVLDVGILLVSRIVRKATMCGTAL